MAVQYDVSAMELIRLFGCDKPASGALWEVKMPALLEEFLRLAKDQPLFETSDFWSGGPYFFYEDIKERIEDDEEYWEEDPEEYEEDEYYQMSKIPREQWGEHMPDYLQIGSDYGVGCVTYGICETDLEKEDPPVYIWNEADSLKDWRVLTDSLSVFLGGIVCDILSGMNYPTAKRVLEKDAWTFEELNHFDLLAQRQIELSSMKKYPSFYGVEVFYRVCVDVEAKTLYLVRDDKELLVIQKAE